MSEKRKEFMIWTVCLLYIGAAFWFLIGKNWDLAFAADVYGSFGKWRDEMLWNLNLIPFRFGYQRVGYSLAGWYQYVAGRIALFVPAGIFLPYYFPKIRDWGIWKFAAVMAAGILALELVQLFLVCGYCDIDDLILNLFGACLGFAGAKCVWKQSCVIS